MIIITTSARLVKAFCRRLKFCRDLSSEMLADDFNHETFDRVKTQMSKLVFLKAVAHSEKPELVDCCTTKKKPTIPTNEEYLAFQLILEGKTNLPKTNQSPF